jgi:hypothetical protein
MKKKHKFEIDDSPPNEAQKKVEAEILAIRNLERGMRKLIRTEVNRAVKKAVADLTRQPRHSSK